MTNIPLAPRRWHHARALFVTATLAAPLVACDLDRVLSVDDIEVATPASVQTPTALPVVANGVIRDFTFAYSGTGAVEGGGRHDNHIVVVGLFTDELVHSGTFPTRRFIDRRAIPTLGPNGTTDNATLQDPYRNLHRARLAAENANALFLSAERANDAGRSVVNSIAGYTYLMFGENYCSGVPFSATRADGTVEFGAPTSTQRIFEIALERFDTAHMVAQAVTNTDALHLASVGRARTLLNQGQFAAAAQAVAAVPDAWMYSVNHSANTAGQNNGVFTYSNLQGRYSVADRKGGVGMPFASANDPRVPVLPGLRLPFDAQFPLQFIAQGKYPLRTSAVPVASGIEARLIRAEAALQAGDATAMLNHLNAARTRMGVPALAAGALPATRDGQIDLLFRERAFSLWLTATRLSDMRRLVRQYQRPPAQVFPSGEYFRPGFEYGQDMNLPIYIDENNNPLFTGCIDRDA